MVKIGKDNELKVNDPPIVKPINISNDGKQFILRLPTKITNYFEWKLRKKGEDVTNRTFSLNWSQL